MAEIQSTDNSGSLGKLKSACRIFFLESFLFYHTNGIFIQKVSHSEIKSIV